MPPMADQDTPAWRAAVMASAMRRGGGAFGHGVAERMQWRCVADVGGIVVGEPPLE